MSDNEKIIVALKSAIYLLHKNRVERFQFVGYEPMYGEDAEDVLEDLAKEYERKEKRNENTCTNGK